MLGIIINPKSGKRAYRRQRLYLFRLLKQRHQPFTYKVTKYAFHAAELARELVEKGYDEILILGGDGTVSEALNGIMSAKVPDKTNIKFGIMPRGTGNDWGRFWGLTKDFKRSLNIFFNTGKPQAVDVGRLTYYRNGEPHYHYFINSIGFGIDAVTCHQTHILKYYVGSHRLLYFFALVAAVWTHKSQPVKLKTDTGLELNKPLFTMNIGNGPFSGGGIKQNPEADPRDGIFHAMFATKPTFKDVCEAVTKLFNGRLLECGFIQPYTAKHITVQTHKYLKIEADGILIDACGPYEIDILPHALQMIVP